MMDGQLGQDGGESCRQADAQSVPHLASQSSSDASLYLEMNLWLAQQKIERLEKERDTLQTKSKSLCQENAEILSELRDLKAPVLCTEGATQTESPTAEDLSMNIEKLASQIKDKELELAMSTWSIKDVEKEKRRQAKRDERLVACEGEIESLKQEVSSHRVDLDDSRAKVNEVSEKMQREAGENRLLKEQNGQLQSLVDHLKNPADQFKGLGSKVDQLMTRMDEERGADNEQFHRLRTENQKLLNRVKALQQDLNLKKEENATALNSIRNAQAKNNNLEVKIEGLKVELNGLRTRESSTETLRAENRKLQGQLKSLYIELAWVVADLDCAFGNFRVFTCNHQSLRRVWDETKVTREKDYICIANGVFRVYGADPQFLTEYGNVRNSLLAHHRAHERDAPGRGDWACDIQEHFENVDGHHSRDISVDYR